MEKIYLFIFSFVYCDVAIIFLLLNTLKNEKRYKVKKVVDVFFYIATYIMIIWWNTVDSNMLYFKPEVILVVSVSMYFLGIIPMFRFLKEKENKRINVRKYTLFSLFSETIVAMSLTYYSLYLMNPDWYIIGDLKLDSVISIAFEFIYFTFSLMLTYSGGELSACGIVPRVFQMIHVFLFMICLGEIASRIFKMNGIKSE